MLEGQGSSQLKINSYYRIIIELVHGNVNCLNEYKILTIFHKSRHINIQENLLFRRLQAYTIMKKFTLKYSAI